MDSLLLLGLAATLIVIVGLSIWSGARNKGGDQAKNGAPIVAGVIIGTLVGGSSTVGTAQLAYEFGMSAWWFTLGGGISCLVLALVYVVPLRRASSPTLVGMIRNEFGPAAGMTASILNSVGTFINIISQLIAASAVIAVILPDLDIVPAVIITAVFMVLYVVFGGTKGAGMVGILKTILLYIAMMACGVLVLARVGGLSSFVEMVHGIDNPEGVPFFSLFARGAGTDLGAGLSLLFGVLTTQTYAQAVLSAKSDRAGQGGALLSAFLIPPIGIGGILVGLYMRANAALYPGLTAKTALTTFVTSHIPSLFAGVILATLFIATVGTGAGLALGISTVLNNDIVKKVTHKFDDARRASWLSKVWIVVILLLACCMSTGTLGDLILQFGFMSMGLRAAVVFCPLCAALFFPGKVDRRWAIAAIIAGPVMVLAGELMGVPFDSLFLGLAAALVLIVLGGLLGGRNRSSLAA